MTTSTAGSRSVSCAARPDRVFGALQDPASWTTGRSAGHGVDGMVRGTIPWPDGRAWTFLVRVLDGDAVERTVHLEVRAKPERGVGVLRSVVAVRAVPDRSGTTVTLTGDGRGAIADAVADRLLDELAGHLTTMSARTWPRSRAIALGAAAVALALTAGAISVARRPGRGTPR